MTLSRNKEWMGFTDKGKKVHDTGQPRKIGRYQGHGGGFIEAHLEMVKKGIRPSRKVEGILKRNKPRQKREYTEPKAQTRMAKLYPSKTWS